MPSSQAAAGAPSGLPLTSTYPRILLTMNILSNPVACRFKFNCSVITVYNSFKLIQLSKHTHVRRVSVGVVRLEKLQHNI